MDYWLKRVWPEGVTQGVSQSEDGVQYNYIGSWGHGGGGYGGGELLNENFMDPGAGGPGMAFVCCINGVTSKSYTKIRMNRASGTYKYTLNSTHFPKVQWQGANAQKEWLFKSVADNDNPVSFGTGFTVQTYNTDKVSRSYDLSPLKVYNNASDGQYIEFDNINDIYDMYKDDLKLTSTAICPKSDKSKPLKMLGTVYSNKVFSILHSVTCEALVEPDSTKTIYVKGFDASKESLDPAAAVCYIMLQGAGGGGGGADEKWGIFNGQAAGGGGGGGGAALLLRFAPAPGVTYKIVLQTGKGGDPGSNGKSGSSGRPGDITYVYIYNNDTNTKLATAFAPGGWGGDGGDGSSGGKAGGQSASGTLMWPEAEIEDRINVVLNVKGGSGSNGSWGGGDGNGSPSIYEDNRSTTTDYFFDVGHVKVLCNVFGQRGYIDNPNGDVGGAGGGSWWAMGGYANKYD